MGLWGVFAIGIMELEKVCSYVGIELWGRSYWVWSYGVIESVVMFYRVMGYGVMGIYGMFHKILTLVDLCL